VLHRKSAGPGHVDLDFALPSVQLAGDEPGVNASNFLAELKRRNVYKVAVAYAVAGWALSQGIAQIFPSSRSELGCHRDYAGNRGGIPDGARNV
jgi:hypothetical protein